uniref:proprotein convertase subtilisin/kexin type 6-like isoform X3 n=2 Tax=Myxine glutinosa TaxID=7769 RepID=UPI00358EAEF0
MLVGVSMLWLVLPLALVPGSVLSKHLSPLYTNHWAVRVRGGSAEAESIAAKFGFTNLGQIGNLKNYFHFHHKGIMKRSVGESRGPHMFIRSEPKVLWVQRQTVKRRVKRGHIPQAEFAFNDAKWPSMWYMHCADEGSQSCRNDMNIVAAWKRGYTGRGVVVTILDDGIERNHPDLAQNYDSAASYDVNGNDRDPMPRYDFTNENKHGTRCAGEVAAAANNSLCVVGVAYEARIGGVRMLDGDVTDMVEAESLSLNLDHIDIYSASWGPDDDGRTVDGPALLARKALHAGILRGRQGRGSIFVWASGNGGHNHDHCSCDGYTNSIYTISVSSTSERVNKPWYLEECSSTLATTYSSGEHGDRKVMTTDLRQRCTDSHTGTSASAPMAAGIIALALQANPLLSWRDVQHLIVRTSRAAHLKATDWKTNGAGYQVSHLYGFGLMDAFEMVRAAETWMPVPPKHTCNEQSNRRPRWIRPQQGLTSVTHAFGCKDNTNSHIVYLEHVVARVSLNHPRRSDLSIYLTSPAGTRSQLLANRPFDHSPDGFQAWEFMTTHCWGEKASGKWRLEIYDTPSRLRNPKATGRLKEWTLILHGTVEPVVGAQPRGDRDSRSLQMPWKMEPKSSTGNTSSYNGPCHKACNTNQECFGPEAKDCFSCAHFNILRNGERECVEECPEDNFSDKNQSRCLPCKNGCVCNPGGLDTCDECIKGRFHYNSSCVLRCPNGTFPNRGECQDCASNCQRCRKNGKCRHCKQGYRQSDGVCELECDDGSYLNRLRGQCEQCHPPCTQCTGPMKNQCLACAAGWILRTRTCQRRCEPGSYWPNNGMGSCLSCDNGCMCCTGQDACTKCAKSFELKDGQCLQTSPCRATTSCRVP